MDDETIHALLPAVAQQAESPTTPFVAATLERLVKKEQIDPEEALYMVAFCLADELERMAAKETDFDLSRYELLLGLLPTMPEKP